NRTRARQRPEDRLLLARELAPRDRAELAQARQALEQVHLLGVNRPSLGGSAAGSIGPGPAARRSSRRSPPRWRYVAPGRTSWQAGPLAARSRARGERARRVASARAASSSRARCAFTRR